MPILYTDQETISRVAYPAQRSRTSRSWFVNLVNLSLRIFLATTISIVIILLSLSICSALRRRTQLSGVTSRRLAEGGEGIDDDELSILEGCLDLESEMGIMQQRAASSSNGDPSTRVNELISMLAHTAAAREGTQERLFVDGRSHFDGQLVEGRIDSQPEGGDLANPHTPSLQTSAEYRASTSVSPVLDPDSWIEEIPSIGSQPEEQQSAVSSLTTGDALRGGQAPEMTASTRAPPRGLRDILRCGGIDGHPYVRLPVLEEGVVPRRIQVSALFDTKRSTFSFHYHLVLLRKLFSMRTLNQRDVDVLVSTVERLVASSWYNSQRSVSGPSPIYAVSMLGHHFMVFDAIICAAEVLGDHMQLRLWWGKFAGSFDTDVPLPSPGTRGREVTKFHINLARRLSAALKIYKTGARPPLLEVVTLKKMLFCFPIGRHRLKGPMWDPWREDGGC